MALRFQQFNDSFLLSKTFTSPLPILSHPRVCITPLPVRKIPTGTVTATANASNTVSTTSNQTTQRRSGNYEPAIWSHEYLQSLRSEFRGEEYKEQINMLTGEVRAMLDRSIEKYPLELLELVDVLKRLGLSHHFENEINKIFEGIYNRSRLDHKMWEENNLYATALQFRLLRQHGFSIPQEVFSSFTDEKGNFKACLCEDIIGILALYEASYLSIEGESILEEAKEFSTEHLQEYAKWSKDEQTRDLVSHALELPLHWRVPRVETKWFIEVYGRKEDKNPNLLDLAILDFNRVQSIHQEDLKSASSWWKSTGLGEKLSFARDRLMPSFFWTTGFSYEPEFGYYRRMMTKLNLLITVIDDVYDVYGTLDELELFTNAVESWDTDAMDQLPDYMKLCFLSLHNTINEIAYDALQEQGAHVIQYLKQTWADLCKAYLLEAKWYHSNYIPKFEEYIDNAWISISAHCLLVHSYVLTTRTIKSQDLESLLEYSNIIRWSSIILRLSDDLGTASDELEKGDVAKSIQCYMIETGASEEDARNHIRHLIGETWKNINKDGDASSPYPRRFIEIAKNVARMSQYMYQYGDGHGLENNETKDRVLSLLIHPIPLSSFPN